MSFLIHPRVNNLPKDEAQQDCAGPLENNSREECSKAGMTCGGKAKI